MAKLEISPQLARKDENLLGSLWARQAPQIVAGYAAASWGIVQFVDWLTNRYTLSTYLTDFVAYLAVLAVPSVLLLAYFRSEPGRTPWSRWEKLGLPVNLALAVVVLWANFAGKELGSINQTVTVTGSNGRTTQREVPKSAFRKRMALFFFENTTGDKRLDWLQQGISTALSTDLAQDLYLDLHDGYDFSDRIKKATFSYRDTLSLGLQREIARYYNLTYLVTGSFSRQKDQYVIQVDLYDTQWVKLLTQRTYRGSNLFKLIDAMSLQLKRDVEVPEMHIAKSVDYPITEVFTRSLDALEHFTRATNLMEFDGEYARAAQLLEQAVAADPTFAPAYLQLFNADLYLGQEERGKKALQQARRYVFKLIDPAQFQLKYLTHWTNREPEATLSAIEQWVALYPEDIKARNLLVSHYTNTAQWEKALVSLRRVLQLDPEQFDHLLKMGDLEARMGNYQRALASYREYSERLPTQARPYENMSYVYLVSGEFEQARTFYQKALAIEGNNIDAQLGLGRVQLQQGNYAAALSQFRLALKQSQTAEDKVNSLDELHGYYRQRRQWQQALQTLEALVTEKAKTGPINAALHQAIYLDTYVRAGRTQEVFAIQRTMQAQAGSAPLLRSFGQLGALKIYLAQEDVQRAAPLIGELTRFFHSYSLDRLSGTGVAELVRAQGKVAELHKEYRQAITAYEQFLKEDPRQQQVNTDVGRCYRLLGQLPDAKAFQQKALRVFPASPEAHFELAEVAAAEKDWSTARQELNIALMALKDADPTDPLANKARELDRRLAQ